ncbi:MAG: Rpn family recombination-promoting nuclease/putative transposase [Terrisporobacter sp.]|uniref:Rpn family recombination-promoting nuclease/putative transposase n=1 Tax=Terrisporobacter sp. TaxID=1965305 RepID=UPI002FC97777
MATENNIHDKSYKDLFSNKDVFVKLVKNHINSNWSDKISEENLSLIDKSFILEDYEKIESDIVYKANIEDQDVIFYVLLEFQSSVDYSMPIRLFFYMSSIWREIVKNTEKNEFKRKDFKLPAIVPIVLYNGKEKWTTVKNLKGKINNYEIFGDSILNFEYILLDVNRYNSKDLMEKGDISSAIFLLDQDNDIEELLYKIRDIALYYNNLSDRDRNLIKHWLRNTVENEIVYDIENILSIDKSEVNKMTSNVSKCINEHFEKAKKQGIEQGIEQGKIEIVMNLYSMGLSLEQIAEGVSLEIQKVEEIIKTKLSN